MSDRRERIRQKIKQKIDDGSITLEQLETADYWQVRALTDERFSETFFKSFKIAAVQYFQNKKDVVTQGQLKSLIVSQFPDVEFERERFGDKRLVKVWLDGKPEEPI